jgi:hypothetical protein
MQTIFLLILNIIFISSTMNAQSKEEQKIVTSSTNNPTSNDDFLKAEISYKIISAPGNTWCYDILLDGLLFIHQPNVPGLPGNEGFKTK